MTAARPHYEHVQPGWAVIVVALAVLAFAGGLLLLAGDGIGALVAAVVVGVLLLAFGWLTVSVDDRDVAIRFGIGVIRRRIALDSVRSCRAVKNSALSGWGIRVGPGVVLYNVSGFDAVELSLLDGRRVRIGTDEPHALENAIAQSIGSSPASAPLAPGRSRTASAIAFTAVVAIPLVLGVLFALEMRDPRAEVAGGALRVESTLYSDRVPLAEVTDLALMTTPPSGGVRTNGFALGGKLRGHFRLPGYGDGMVFADRAVAPYLLVRTRDSYLLVGFDDPARTRALYDQLRKVNAR